MTLDDEWGSDQLFGVQVELPLFDGLIRESDVAREKAELEKSPHYAGGSQRKSRAGCATGGAAIT